MEMGGFLGRIKVDTNIEFPSVGMIQSSDNLISLKQVSVFDGSDLQNTIGILQEFLDKLISRGGCFEQ